MPDRATFSIYYLLLAGQFIFALLAWFLIYQVPDAVMVESTRTDLYLPALVLVLTGGAAYYIDSSRAKQAVRFTFNEATKPLRYRHTVLLRSAIVQAGNLLVLSTALMTKRVDLLLVFLPGLLLYFYFRPSTQQFQQRYEKTS